MTELACVYVLDDIHLNVLTYRRPRFLTLTLLSKPIPATSGEPSKLSKYSLKFRGGRVRWIIQSIYYALFACLFAGFFGYCMLVLSWAIVGAILNPVVLLPYATALVVLMVYIAASILGIGAKRRVAKVAVVGQIRHTLSEILQKSKILSFRSQGDVFKGKLDKGTTQLAIVTNEVSSTHAFEMMVCVCKRTEYVASLYYYDNSISKFTRLSQPACL